MSKLQKDFVIDAADFEFYKKIQVPAPTFCPQCRFQRRASFRNERKLFRNKSAKTGKDILALYPPESGMTVYDSDEWWADDWDAMSHGVGYDFSRPFFAQFHELVKRVPKNGRATINNVRSDYCANIGDSKDCYLVFNSSACEDSGYANAVDYCKNVYDNSFTTKCERIYEGFWLNGCYQSHFTSQSVESSGLWFCRDCKGCTDCFGSANLRNKKYHIFNKPYTKDEYEKKISEMRLDTWSGLCMARDKAYKFWLETPYKFHQGINNVDSSGSYVSNSKNVKEGYLVRGGENLRYAQYILVPPVKDSYDITVWGDHTELCYENTVCGYGVYGLHFSSESWPQVKDSEYTILCSSSTNLFGCVGLRKKQFCIFNTQYSKSEYELLRKKIIQHMNEVPYVDKAGRIYKYGEFFPTEHAPIPYNASIVQEHFPLTKEEVVEQGYSWYDVSPQEYQVTTSADALPDRIADVTDDVLKQVIGCLSCKRAYRIIPSELAFLRNEKIPLPRFCVDCRHTKRISQRVGSRLYDRVCDCRGTSSSNGLYQNNNSHIHDAGGCENEFKTGYPTDSPEIVYCEACYNAVVA